LITSLSVKLRLTPQAQTRARDIARERARTPVGRRPWHLFPRGDDGAELATGEKVLLG
jgi:hypothetical protein